MFKKGHKYTRKEVALIVEPEKGQAKGGKWVTGGVVVDNLLLNFLNIGLPGTTGHDFDNEYDSKTGLVTWFGRPNSHSSQPKFQKIISGKLIPHFFVRWEDNDRYTYLGEGHVVHFEDGAITKHGKSIKLLSSLTEAKYIIPNEVEEENIDYSFVFEKHLEDFLVSNWNTTFFAEKYKIFEEEGKKVGRQYQTATGPIDILAIDHDQKDFLVVELKRDRASDVAIGQTLRYMGWVKQNMCSNQQTVNGCIVGTKADSQLEHALHAVDNIDFARYKLDFQLFPDSLKKFK